MGNLIKLSDRKGFSINLKERQKEAEIVIYSAIGESFWEDTISAQSFHQEIKSLPDSVETINLRINSPGGDVFDGITIYNRLKQHKAKVVAYVDGMAASIASVIMLAADEIYIGEGAQVMIHKPWTMAVGDARDLEETIDRLDDVEEQILGIYLRNTKEKTTRSELRAMMAKTTWMDADESIEFGFATGKIESGEAVKIAACNDQNLPWMGTAPKDVVNKTYVKKQIGNFKKEVDKFLAR